MSADGSDDKKGPVGSIHDEKHAPRIQVDNAISNINAKLANPLAGLSHEELMASGAEFARTHGLGHLEEVFKKGALAAQDPLVFENVPYFTEDDKKIFRRELTHRWDHPGTLYYLVILCSVAAAVQGMDEAVINGANLFFAPHFHLNSASGNASQNEWLLGLVNSAPYLCCAVLGCWLTEPLNNWLGRRGTIFFCAAFSFLTCIWQGVTNSWPHLFVARFFLGLGVGPKSSTVPVYAAECSPAIRGALVMMWQMWTAFGIMLGYVADLAFYKGRYPEAYRSLERLRHHLVQAARDLYYIYVLLEAEKELTRGRNRYLELFTIPRNRRAALGSFIVLFMQQFCGVNVIAYYSSTIFTQAGFSEIRALLASWGFGALNFVMALPAVYTIDTFGRRNLLLVTFPLMSLFLLMTGFAFWIPEGNGRLAVVALGIYLFDCVYSPGEGPVPFPYAAEAFPRRWHVLCDCRQLALVCGRYCSEYSDELIDLCSNFVVAITFPRLLGAFKPQGAFGWYAAWNIVGFFAILLFVPETKALSLEDLDQVLVFSVPTQTHAAYQIKALPHNIKKYIFRMKVDPLPPLYEHEGAIGEKHYAPGGAGHA
ncbi:MFS sugar transporter [Lactarius hatsudake]|nr:MFS sugar transporter [Lactarius hatsudake]